MQKTIAPFDILILLLWLGITGFVRFVAPSWQLNVDKKHAKPGQQVVPDSQRLKRIRVVGTIRLAICVALIGLAAFSVGLSPAPAQPQGANELEQLLFKRGAEFVRANKGMGLTIAAISGDREAVVEIGLSRLASRQAVTKDTLFEIGSITKVFTGIAL